MFNMNTICTIQEQIIKSNQCECIIRSIFDANKLNILRT